MAEVTAVTLKSPSAFAQVEENCIASKVRVGRIHILILWVSNGREVLFQIPLQKVNSHGRWAFMKLYEAVSEISV